MVEELIDVLFAVEGGVGGVHGAVERGKRRGRREGGEAKGREVESLRGWLTRLSRVIESSSSVSERVGRVRELW